jgi:hypothetical protein
MTLAFLGAWAVLDAVANVRYPGKETRLWYLLPSVDVLVVFAAFALVAWRGRRVPVWVHALLALVLLLVRLLRIGDGVSTRFLSRPFNLYLNLSLLPELPRLMRETVPVPLLVLGALALTLGLTAVVVVSFYALRVAERALREPANVRLVGGVALALGVLSVALPKKPLGPQQKPDDRFHGAFASSGVARLVTEAVAVSRAQGYREREERAITNVRERLRTTPTDLSKLKGANVLLFIVESYGQCVLEEAPLRTRLRPDFAAFESELGAAGYTVVSSVLDSPTFGGSSWLAHAALNTGLRPENQLEYALLVREKPITLADFFRAAGYRTVLVQPATKRTSLEDDYLTFDRKYFAAHFDYQGPSLGWGTMPDQFVIDFVHRRELDGPQRDRPRFVEYALITSHAPWTRQASVVEDWSSMGNGAILKTLPLHEHDTSWSQLDRAAAAYADALAYDFAVLRSYLRDQLKDDSLIIILGDHQPPGGVTGGSTGHGVPVHVLSRRHSLVEPFLARGYTPGMNPASSGPRAGMESFLFSFLRDFSQDLRQTSAVPNPVAPPSP